MSNYAIQIGEIAGYRYVGIKPPVSEELRERIFGELDENIQNESTSNGYDLPTIAAGRDSAHSELGLETAMMEVNRISITIIARKIADVIRSNGHTVVIDSELKHLDGDLGLFENRR